MTLQKGHVWTEEQIKTRGLARRQEYCKYGHLLEETRIYNNRGMSVGCGVCKSLIKSNPINKFWDSILRNRHMTRGEYEVTLRHQGGRCAICGRLPEDQGGRFKRLAVDHDHETGRIRGLLCAQCNRGIGLLGDSPEILLEASAYLGRNV